MSAYAITTCSSVNRQTPDPYDPFGAIPCPHEYFRPDATKPLDADGHEIDSATRELDEIDAWLDHQAKVVIPRQRTDAEWDEMSWLRRWQELVEMTGPVGDGDIHNAGLPVG